MPRFYGLRLTLGNHHAIAPPTSTRRSSTRTTKSPHQVTKPTHSRGNSSGALDRDVMEEDYIAEDYKRPRAATFTCARGAPVFEPDAVARSDDRCLFAEMLGAGSTSSTGSRAGDSIYSLASPWVPSRQAVMQRTSSSRPEGQAASGGGRALCFNEADAGEEPEQHHQHSNRFFAALRPQRSSSSIVSVESEPVDIPNNGQADCDDDGLEEEGWVSLWDTYTRLFPGNYTGCSPPDASTKPPPDSPLYATPKASASAVTVNLRSRPVTPSPPNRSYDAREGGVWGLAGTVRGTVPGSPGGGASDDEEEDVEDYDDSTEDLESAGCLMFDLEM